MSDTEQSTNQNNDGGIFTPLSFSDAQNQTSQPVQTQDPEIKEETGLDFGDGEMVSIQPQVPVFETKVPTPIGETKKDDSLGVTFIDEEKQTPPEKNIFSSDSSFKEKEMEAVGITPVQTPTQASSESQPKPVETKDLEDDFSKTFSTPIGTHEESAGSDPLAIEEAKLRKLHKELKDKAGAKKIVVKERLEKLKQEKESLGKELEDIKELEGIASKIEEKLKSLETIDSEIDSLEAKAKEELQ